MVAKRLSMSKTSPATSVVRTFYTFLLVLALSSTAFADDRFAVAIGSHDMLVIFGPNGQRVAELPVPSISQSVTIGATTFQVSYGRDATASSRAGQSLDPTKSR